VIALFALGYLVVGMALVWAVTELVFYERLGRWWKAWRDREKIRAQWPDGLVLLAGALRAGLTLPEALTVLVEESPEPLRAHLKQRAHALEPWLPLSQRIEILFQEDALSLVRAVLLVAHESGGKLPSLLDASVRLLRRKQELRERAQTLTAQGRLSAWVVGASPFTMMALLSVLSPGYMTLFFTTATGQVLLGLVVILVAAGFYFVQRAAAVEP
jgi:tight adherence protein B